MLVASFDCLFAAALLLHRCGLIYMLHFLSREADLFDKEQLNNKITRVREAVSAVDWSADGKWVVSGGWDDVLKIWNTETGQARTLRGHTDDLTVLALSAKGERMVSASDDRTVRVWDLRTGKLRQTLRGHTAAVISLAISPDGRRAVSGSKNELKFWELK